MASRDSIVCVYVDDLFREVCSYSVSAVQNSPRSLSSGRLPIVRLVVKKPLGKLLDYLETNDIDSRVRCVSPKFTALHADKPKGRPDDLFSCKHVELRGAEQQILNQ